MQPANRGLQLGPELCSAACFVPKDEKSSGQGTCLQRSGYPSHQGGRCCYYDVVIEVSDFTDRRLIKQQTRPCDIRLPRLLWNSVISHF